MKIKSLLESQTPASSVSNTTISAPEFGRDDEHLEETSAVATGSGSVATVSSPIGKVQSRGSIFSGIKTSKKFPNSKQVSEGEPGDLEHELEKQEQERDRKRDEEAEEELKEGAYDEGVSDGIQGTPNRRASSIYGPEAGEYQRGYEIGVKKGEQLKKERLSKSQADTSPYENMSDQELMQLRKEIQQRSNQRQEIYSKLRGSSLSFDPKIHLPKNDSELRMQHAQDNKAWNAINQVLGQRGVNVNNLSEDVAEGLNEMDSEGYKGTRDDYELGKGKEGKGTPVKADKAKKDFAKMFQKNVDKANKEKKATDEKVRKQGVAETKADPTSTWVVYDGDRVKRFKTHQGAKAYAEQHGGKVASSAHYADKIQGKQGVAEGSIYKKDQDLSSIPTQELEAFVKKHWGGGVPTYGQGESVKRAMRELRRRQKQGVAEGFLGDREYNRVMPFVKRIASEVSDYDRDEFGEELWSLLDQKYGSKFAQSVLDDLDFYWDTYTELTGKQGVAEGNDVPQWRVEQSDATGRYYVVSGYTNKSRRVWKSKQGAGDFSKKADAEAKAQELNQGVAEGSEQSFKVTYDVHGSNKEKPLYTNSKTVRAGSEQEAISRLRKLVGGTNHRVEKQDVAENLEEAEISEEMLAHELYKDLQIFKKGADKGIGKKAKDKEIGKKPKDRDIVTKEQQ